MTDRDQAARFARFLAKAGKLKRTPRTGWLDRGVPPDLTESVADHSFRVTLMTWLAAAEAPELDRDRVLKLALIHDLAEAITGDLTPHDSNELLAMDPSARRDLLNRRRPEDPLRQRAKREAEERAMAELLSDLSPAQSAEIFELWVELSDRTTGEARFVKEIDVLETYLQSREYLAADANLPMGSFELEVREAIETPSLRRLRDAILQVIQAPVN
jgi:putative hydrolase of HD superfamily